MLGEDKLYAMFKKCDFWMDQVHFLRHIVSKDGISIDSGKIEAVSN